jgi:hypothetical protein
VLEGGLAANLQIGHRPEMKKGLHDATPSFDWRALASAGVAISSTDYP